MGRPTTRRVTHQCRRNACPRNCPTCMYDATSQQCYSGEACLSDAQAAMWGVRRPQPLWMPITILGVTGVSVMPNENAGNYLPEYRPQECSEQVVTGLAMYLSKFTSLSSPGLITRFHSSQPPAIVIADYVTRIRNYFGCSIECFVMAFVYLGRVVKYNPNMIISQWSVHRLLINSMMLATKHQDDDYYSNAYYARVGGVSLAELNILEAAMLNLLDWRLVVTPVEFETCRRMLCAMAQGEYDSCPTDAKSCEDAFSF